MAENVYAVELHIVDPSPGRCYVDARLKMQTEGPKAAWWGNARHDRYL